MKRKLSRKYESLKIRNKNENGGKATRQNIQKQIAKVQKCHQTYGSIFVHILSSRINMISKNDLDKRICDLEGGFNEQTYREHIRESEKAFCMEEVDIEKLNEIELNEYINFLDWLWVI